MASSKASKVSKSNKSRGASVNENPNGVFVMKRLNDEMSNKARIKQNLA
jgi:hypothetical protein